MSNLNDNSNKQLDYNTLRELYRQESKQAELTKVPDDFYQKLNSLLIETKTLANKSQKLEKLIEYKNMINIAESFVNIRIRKIIRLASLLDNELLTKKKLTHEEEEFAKNLINVIKDFKTKHTYKEDMEQHSHKKIVILQEVPEYVGKDGKTYGPFNKNQVVDLPVEESDYLISTQFAKEYESV
ncbi:MAG: hypothetical protein N3E37_03555 [Candidatus Micrarchaeota archaeon]|nr:hypothetical protein [Candidatus Micrarchaeota archaeon]